MFSYNQAGFSVIRWGNFKGYFKVFQMDQPFSNISMSTYAPVAVDRCAYQWTLAPSKRQGAAVELILDAERYRVRIR